MKRINWFYHNLSSLLGQVADGSRGEVKVASLQGAQHHCVRDIAGSEGPRVKSDNLKKLSTDAYLKPIKTYNNLLMSDLLFTYSAVLDQRDITELLEPTHA